MEHKVEACPFGWEPAWLKRSGTSILHVPELVIEVPKISSSPRRSRRRRVPIKQTVEQLVDVPTIVSFSSSFGNVEQNADIPAPHGRHGRGGREVFKVHALDRIHQRFVEQNTLTFQFLMVVAEEEVFAVNAQIRIQLLHPRTRLMLRMRFLQGGFALFSTEKKCEVGSALGVGTECGLYSVHAGGSSRRLLGG